MKLGEVMKKERERRRLSVETAAAGIGIQMERYQELEEGNSPIEQWGPRLGKLAIKLKTPTSRLISETGKLAGKEERRTLCGDLIRRQREKIGLNHQELAAYVGISLEELKSIESGDSPIELYGPILLRFAEIIKQPVFNLFYPCGLPLEKLTDYP